MAWKGKFFGALFGFFITRNVVGALVGALIGHFFDESAGQQTRSRTGGASNSTVSEVFFRTTFELMGFVAKADGLVTEAEIDAARRLMGELHLGPQEIQAAIACFRVGKAPNFDATVAIDRFYQVCARRHDLLRAFLELQLRAALAGNGLSVSSRVILLRVAERFGVSGLEFAYMEAALRARAQARSSGAGFNGGGGFHGGAGGTADGPGGGRGPGFGGAGFNGGAGFGRGGGGGGGGPRPAAARPLADFYAELEVAPTSSDQEVTKAYRRQMSRHHPDKLVANGLPESMAQVAKEKTQRIQEAYETIRTARGMR